MTDMAIALLIELWWVAESQENDGSGIAEKRLLDMTE